MTLFGNCFLGAASMRGIIKHRSAADWLEGIFHREDPSQFTHCARNGLLAIQRQIAWQCSTQLRGEVPADFEKRLRYDTRRVGGDDGGAAIAGLARGDVDRDLP
jgi:hypothetical protein